MDDPHFLRGLILFDQGRPDLAEPELRQALAADPDHGRAHALLALCLARRDQLAEATREAQAAVHLLPEDGFVHYALAAVLDKRNHLAEAEAAISEAIRLEPHDPDYFALLASLRLQREDWTGALEAADKGLEGDPEHVGCNNLRATALVKLGRREEAGATIDAALARDPENAFSHANRGWTLLERGGDRTRAMQHFREALRLDPGLDYARAGIVEALKAGNPLYRLLLHYFLWIAKLSPQARWMFVIGMYVGFRLLGSLRDQNPELRPYLTPLIYAYIVFAIFTWVGPALFNLLLRVHRFGRLALSRDQLVASNWLGGVLLLSAAAFLAYFITGDNLGFIAGMGLVLLLVPVSGTFACQPGWPRRVMALYTSALALVGLGVLALIWLADRGDVGVEPALDFIEVAIPVYIWGSVLSGFLANFLAQYTPRR